MRRVAKVLDARAQHTNVSPIRVARFYAHAGDSERALTWLERAYDRHELNLIHIGVGWDWDALHGEPRFRQLLRRINVPPPKL